MNCFSSGRDVNSRCRSVPSNSVTKYLQPKNVTLVPLDRRGEVEWSVHMSSSGEIKISLRLIICNKVSNSIRKKSKQHEIGATYIFMS